MNNTLEKQLAYSRLEALRSQMNPHFIFNAITTIQNFILANDKRLALEYLDELSSLIRKFLDHSRADVILLSEELALLISYINLESQRFSNRFGFQLNVAEDVDADFIEIPPMLLQPYIENAIRHGLMHKVGYGLLSIDIKKQDNFLVCTIEDDGIGRKKSAELNAWRPKEHKSVGMEVTKERLELLNNIHNSQLNVEITDLYHENKEGAGTRVVLYIPIKDEWTIEEDENVSNG
ncbi:MAG: sensor histidine kinase [Bacteroidia bacterium]